MNLTESRLKQIIQEELQNVINDLDLDEQLTGKTLDQAILNAKPAKPLPPGAQKEPYDPAKTRCPAIAQKYYKARGIMFINRQKANNGIGYTAVGMKGFEKITGVGIPRPGDTDCDGMARALRQLIANIRKEKSAGTNTVTKDSVPGRVHTSVQSMRRATKGTVSARVISTKREGDEVVVTVEGMAPDRVKGKKAEGRAKIIGRIGFARRKAASKARLNLLKGEFVD